MNVSSLAEPPDRDDLDLELDYAGLRADELIEPALRRAAEAVQEAAQAHAVAAAREAAATREAAAVRRAAALASEAAGAPTGASEAAGAPTGASEAAGAGAPARERTGGGSKRQRVPALPAEDRRAALIAATIPLLQAHGINVSTRQIADAAGVAEGTIFGVFRDKASLIDAAVVAAFDSTPIIRKIRAIDRGLDLRARLTAATQMLREHVSGHGQLLIVIRSIAMAGPRGGPKVDLMAARYLILYALAELIEPDAALLRRNPSTVARLLVSLVISPRDGFGDLSELGSDEIVSLILDGLLIRDNPGENPC